VGAVLIFQARTRIFFDAIIILCLKAPGDEQITKFDRALKTSYFAEPIKNIKTEPGGTTWNFLT
jgi:hypothetical protein